jgi:hypothetical protein
MLKWELSVFDDFLIKKIYRYGYFDDGGCVQFNTICEVLKATKIKN